MISCISIEIVFCWSPWLLVPIVTVLLQCTVFVHIDIGCCYCFSAFSLMGRISRFPHFPFVFPFYQRLYFFSSIQISSIFFLLSALLKKSCLIILAYGHETAKLAPQSLYPIYDSFWDSSNRREMSAFSHSKHFFDYYLTFNLLLIRFQVWCGCSHKFISSKKSIPSIIFFVDFSATDISSFLMLSRLSFFLIHSGSGWDLFLYIMYKFLL